MFLSKLKNLKLYYALNIFCRTFNLSTRNLNLLNFSRVVYFFKKKKKILEALIIAQFLSRHMGKPTICLGENKDADQLRGNREADQRLCFRYSDSIILLLLKSDISSF